MRKAVMSVLKGLPINFKTALSNIEGKNCKSRSKNAFPPSCRINGPIHLYLSRL